MINTFNGLRGYCCVWVFFYHFLKIPLNNHDLGIGRHVEAENFKWILYQVYIPIDLLCLMSGFVIAYNYRDIFLKEFSFSLVKRFFIKRFFRIYPVYVVGLLACVALYYAGIYEEKYADVSALPYHFSLTQTWWFYPTEKGALWNFPMWTVSAEWLAYFCFIPIACVFMREVPLMLLALLIIAPFIPYTYFDAVGLQPMFRVVIHFFIGCALFQFYDSYMTQKSDPISRFGSIFIFLSLISFLVLIFDGIAVMLDHKLYTFLFLNCILILALTRSKGYATRIFDNRISRFFGKISYSFYVIHFPVLIFLSQFDEQFIDSLIFEHHGNQLYLWLFVVAVFAVVTAVSTLLYYAVEKPILTRSRKMKMSKAVK